jgi:hypothetical protein
MTEQVAIALIAAGAAIVGALAGGGVGVWLGARYGAQKDRKDRLRALYVEVMGAALRLTPKALGYKMSEDSDVPLPGEIDAFIARLMVESEKDDDKVRSSFIGVFNFGTLYGLEKQEKARPSELQKTADLVRKNVEDLQRAMRERLK